MPLMNIIVLFVNVRKLTNVWHLPTLVSLPFLCLAYCSSCCQHFLQMKEAITDVRVSEIMDVYEQKLTALAVSTVCYKSVCLFYIHMLLMPQCQSVISVLLAV